MYVHAHVGVVVHVVQWVCLHVCMPRSIGAITATASTQFNIFACISVYYACLKYANK